MEENEEKNNTTTKCYANITDVLLAECNVLEKLMEGHRGGDLCLKKRFTPCKNGYFVALFFPFKY